MNKDKINEIAAILGTIIGAVIGTALVALVYWAVLVLMVKIPLTFIQVWEAVSVFDSIVNYIKRQNARNS